METLLRFFAEEQKDQECFCACLFSCYPHVQPDVAMELAWRYHMVPTRRHPSPKGVYLIPTGPAYRSIS